MLKYVWLYLMTAVVFFAIDLVWLIFVARTFYASNLGPTLLRETPNWGVAGAFYALYLVGVIALAIMPGIDKGAWTEALWRGALLGLVAYATYDLTNWSTIPNWPGIVSIVDMIWGTVLTGSVATAGYFIASWLGFGK
jgi:uncharacterized membrane protein